MRREDGITLLGLQAALKQFRLDVIAAIADLYSEINSTQEALVEAGRLDQERLLHYRQQAALLRHQFEERYHETVGPAHTLRESALSPDQKRPDKKVH